MTSLWILCDENIDRQVSAYLEKNGHHGEHVVDVLDPGADDETDIAPYARENDRIVLTKDTDFLILSDSEHAGVFFIEDHTLSAYDIASIIIEIAAYHTRDQLRGTTYVTEGWL